MTQVVRYFRYELESSECSTLSSNFELESSKCRIRRKIREIGCILVWRIADLLYSIVLLSTCHLEMNQTHWRQNRILGLFFEKFQHAYANSFDPSATSPLIRQIRKKMPKVYRRLKFKLKNNSRTKHERSWKASIGLTKLIVYISLSYSSSRLSHLIYAFN